MIVKVQCTTNTNDEVDPITLMRVLIYNEDRSIFYEGPCPSAILEFATLCEHVQVERGAIKVYAVAHLCDKQICIDEEAPWQERW